MKFVNIAFACFPVSSLKRAQAFYENVLELKATKKWVSNDKSGMIEYDVGPTTIAIGAGASNFKKGKGGPAVALEVADFNATIKSLKGKKAKFLMLPQDTPICHMALISDPDGNKLMIHQRKKKSGKS